MAILSFISFSCVRVKGRVKIYELPGPVPSTEVEELGRLRLFLSRKKGGIKKIFTTKFEKSRFHFSKKKIEAQNVIHVDASDRKFLIHSVIRHLN